MYGSFARHVWSTVCFQREKSKICEILRTTFYILRENLGHIGFPLATSAPALLGHSSLLVGVHPQLPRISCVPERGTCCSLSARVSYILVTCLSHRCDVRVTSCINFDFAGIYLLSF